MPLYTKVFFFVIFRCFRCLLDVIIVGCYFLLSPSLSLDANPSSFHPTNQCCSLFWSQFSDRWVFGFKLVKRIPKKVFLCDRKLHHYFSSLSISLSRFAICAEKNECWLCCEIMFNWIKLIDFHEKYCSFKKVFFAIIYFSLKCWKPCFQKCNKATRYFSSIKKLKPSSKQWLIALLKTKPILLKWMKLLFILVLFSQNAVSDSQYFSPLLIFQFMFL